jgi:hypothetical protein
MKLFPKNVEGHKRRTNLTPWPVSKFTAAVWLNGKYGSM